MISVYIDNKKLDLPDRILLPQVPSVGERVDFGDALYEIVTLTYLIRKNCPYNNGDSAFHKVSITLNRII